MVNKVSKLNESLWFTQISEPLRKERLDILPGPVFSARDQRGDRLICSAADTGLAGFIVLRREIPGGYSSILFSEAFRTRSFGEKGPVPSGCPEGINEFGLTVLLRPLSGKAIMKRSIANPVTDLLDRCSDIPKVGSVLKDVSGVPELLNAARLFLADRSGRLAEIAEGENGPEIREKDMLLYDVENTTDPGGAISRTHAVDIMRGMPLSSGTTRQIRIYNCTEISVLIRSGGESYEFSPLKDDPKLVSNKVFRPASRTVRDEIDKEYRNTYEKDTE